MLDRLERKGLIVRNLDAQDRRQVRLLLTHTGETLSSVLPTREIAAMNEFTASLMLRPMLN
jgi:DNA-binding MarR family transcriptional regulator